MDTRAGRVSKLSNWPALDDVRHQQRRCPLSIRWQLVEVIPPIAGRDRRHPLRLVLRQIIQRHRRPTSVQRRDDLLCDRPSIERVTSSRPIRSSVAANPGCRNRSPTPTFWLKNVLRTPSYSSSRGLIVCKYPANLADIGEPSRAYPTAGAKISASSFDPNRSCNAAQPPTTPGTVTARGPRSGISVCPRSSMNLTVCPSPRNQTRSARTTIRRAGRTPSRTYRHQRGTGVGRLRSASRSWRWPR